MEKVLFSWSGGKDSALALYETLHSENYEVTSLLTTITEDYDRVSLHGVRRALIEQQARALGLPLTKVFIPKDCSNGDYEARMRDTLAEFKQNGVSRVAFGDIFLEELRKYREDNLAQLGIGGLFPLWGRDSGPFSPLGKGQRRHHPVVCHPGLRSHYHLHRFQSPGHKFPGQEARPPVPGRPPASGRPGR